MSRAGLAQRVDDERAEDEDSPETQDDRWDRASSSTRGPTTERIQPGASSVKKRAMAIEIGVARSSAPSEVTTVPKMNDLAPKSALFWSHA